MKSTPLLLVCSLCLVTALFSCLPREKEAGPTLFGNLYVRYLQDGKEIKAEASFFEGDSVQLATPVSILGGVSFQGSGMESRNIQDKLIRYQYQNVGDYPSSFIFQAQDHNGAPSSFQLEMAPVSSFSFPDSIRRSQEFSLDIQPAPGPGESMAILFTDAAGKASLVEVPAPISQKITLSPGQLAALTPGLNQVYLVKKQHSAIQKGRFDVQCQVEYYTEVKEVEIGD